MKKLFRTFLSLQGPLFLFGCEANPELVRFMGIETQTTLPAGTLELSITNEERQPLAASVVIRRQGQDRIANEGTSQTGKLTFMDIAPGDYYLQCKLTDYQVVEKQFVITPTKVTAMSLVMESAIGTLRVWVIDPKGKMVDDARVGIGGVFQMTQAGEALFSLLSNEYIVTVSKNGFKTTQSKVFIKPKTTVPLSLVLESAK